MQRPPNCRQICPLRLSIRPSKGFIPKNLFMPSNAKYSVFTSRQVNSFSYIKDKSLKCQKLGLAKMKIKNCNFCKSINTLKINKINYKNVKMSKCQLISRAWCVCVYACMYAHVCAYACITFQNHWHFWHFASFGT